MDQHPTFAEPDGIRSPVRTPLRAEPTPQNHALVLGGGGVAGIAWEIGVLRGVSDVAPDLLPSLTVADLIIGTSAGSVVAAQITSGIGVEVFYAAQLDPHTNEIEVNFDHEAQRAELGDAIAGSTSVEHARQRIGALADLAAGCDRVLITAPSFDAPATPYDDLHGELERLKPATVFVVSADAPSIVAFGANPLSQATRSPAALRP